MLAKNVRLGLEGTRFFTRYVGDEVWKLLRSHITARSISCRFVSFLPKKSFFSEEIRTDYNTAGLTSKIVIIIIIIVKTMYANFKLNNQFNFGSGSEVVTSPPLNRKDGCSRPTRIRARCLRVRQHFPAQKNSHKNCIQILTSGKTAVFHES